MDKDIMKDIQNNVDFNLKKMDIIKVGYYGLALVLLILPMFQVNVSIFGTSGSVANGFQTIFNGNAFIFGLLYLIAMCGGAATLFVKPIMTFEKIAFVFAPIACLVILFLVNSSVSSTYFGIVQPAFGFWLIVLLHLAAIGYQWYPTIMKILNEKK